MVIDLRFRSEEWRRSVHRLTGSAILLVVVADLLWSYARGTIFSNDPRIKFICLLTIPVCMIVNIVGCAMLGQLEDASRMYFGKRVTARLFPPTRRERAPRAIACPLMMGTLRGSRGRAPRARESSRRSTSRSTRGSPGRGRSDDDDVDDAAAPLAEARP